MMQQALIVTHGTLGASLVGCAQHIAGGVEGLAFFSNEGLGLSQLAEGIAARLSAMEDGEIHLFVDFKGSSCHSGCRRAMKLLDPETASRIPVLHLGVNLPMVLAFLNKRDQFNGVDLGRAVCERGLAGVQFEELQP